MELFVSSHMVEAEAMEIVPEKKTEKTLEGNEKLLLFSVAQDSGQAYQSLSSPYATAPKDWCLERYALSL